MVVVVTATVGGGGGGGDGYASQSRNTHTPSLSDGEAYRWGLKKVDNYPPPPHKYIHVHTSPTGQPQLNHPPSPQPIQATVQAITGCASRTRPAGTSMTHPKPHQYSATSAFLPLPAPYPLHPVCSSRAGPPPSPHPPHQSNTRVTAGRRAHHTPQMGSGSRTTHPRGCSRTSPTRHPRFGRTE